MIMLEFISWKVLESRHGEPTVDTILKCRQAIGQPSPESESLAWETLVPLVGKLRSFHKFSEKMDVVVPNILRVICSVQSNEENANKRLIS